MLPNDFIHVYEVMKRIEEENESVYIVGGAIRSHLLKKTINDIDLTTSAPPKKIASIFSHVVDIASEHGTVLVVHEGIPYEITTYRTDQSSLEADLGHRDFTMNAIAMNKEGRLIDYHNGINAIEERLIHPVGQALDRITEDPLRMLRACRFISELEFSISDTLLQVMKVEVSRLELVARERILQEWQKLLKGKAIREAFSYMESIKVFHHLPLFQAEPAMADQLAKVTEPFIHLAEFVAFMSIQAPIYRVQDWVRKWKMSNDTRYQAKKLVHYYKDYQLHSLHDVLIYDIEEKIVPSFIDLLHKLEASFTLTEQAWRQRRKDLPIQNRSDIVISGHDIIDMHPKVKVGQWLGKMLRDIEVAIVEGRLNNDEKEIKEWIKCHPPVND